MARNYVTVLLEEGRSATTIRQAKVVLCAMFGMAVADGYVDYNPFHDVKIPKVPGQRAIKVATPEQYLTVRACLPNKPAQVFSTVTPGCSSDPTSVCVSPAHARPGLPIFQAGDLGVRSACGKVRLLAVRNGLCRSLTAINRRSRWQAFPQVNALRNVMLKGGVGRRPSAFQANGPLGAAAWDGSAGNVAPGSVPDQSVGHGPQRSMTDSLQRRPSAPWQVRRASERI